MESRGKPWQQIAKSKPFANEPFGLVGTVFNILKIREWREQEHKAGRLSSSEDFYRTKHLGFQFCEACRSRGINVHPIDWDGETPLFEECQVCGGTGKLSPPATKTDLSE